MVSFRNNLKTALLLGALFGLLVGVGSFWGAQGMIVGGVLAVVMNFGAWFWSDRLAVAAMLFNMCKKCVIFNSLIINTFIFFDKMQ